MDVPEAEVSEVVGWTGRWNELVLRMDSHEQELSGTVEQWKARTWWEKGRGKRPGMCPLKVPRSTFHGCRHTDASRCAQRLLYIRRHASPFLISCASPLSAGSQPAAASTPDREASRNWDFASYRHVVCRHAKVGCSVVCHRLQPFKNGQSTPAACCVQR